MNDKQRIEELEEVLAQFLQPIRNIPFPLIVKSMSGHALIPMERSNHLDEELTAKLVQVAILTAELVRKQPIRRNRPNEVGNDIEPFVMQAAIQLGMSAERPRTASGRLKTTGYPDILLDEAGDRPTYLECKSFGEGAAMTTMRSFFLSPSKDFKVTMDARHLLLAFGMHRKPINGSGIHLHCQLIQARRPVQLEVRRQIRV